jgi:ketosteroid isomerase-like protein
MATVDVDLDSAAEVARRLVGAFGEPDAIGTLLADDAQWWITPSVGILGSPTVGRSAILEAMAVIFSAMYSDVSTTVHHVIGDGQLAACRFTMRAKAVFAEGRPYENEYSLWVQVANGQAVRVWEYLDVAHAMNVVGLGSGDLRQP